MSSQPSSRQVRKEKDHLTGLKRERGKLPGPKKTPEVLGRARVEEHEDDDASEPDKRLNESSEMEVYGQVSVCLTVWPGQCMSHRMARSMHVSPYGQVNVCLTVWPGQCMSHHIARSMYASPYGQVNVCLTVWPGQCMSHRMARSMYVSPYSQVSVCLTI